MALLPVVEDGRVMLRKKALPHNVDRPRDRRRLGQIGMAGTNWWNK